MTPTQIWVSIGVATILVASQLGNLYVHGKEHNLEVAKEVVSCYGLPPGAVGPCLKAMEEQEIGNYLKGIQF